METADNPEDTRCSGLSPPEALSASLRLPEAAVSWLADLAARLGQPVDVVLMKAAGPLAERYTATWDSHPRAHGGNAGRTAYEVRLAAALAYHWWRYEQDRPRDLSEVIERIRSGRLAYGQVGVDILWEVTLAEGFVQGDDGAARRFVSDYSEVIAATARAVGGPVAEQELQGFEAELILPREDRPPKLTLYAGHTPMKHWLRQVVRNEWVGRARRPKLHGSAVSGEAIDDRPRADEVAQERECLELLTPFLARVTAVLKAEEGVLLRMVLLDGMSQQDVARLLKVNKSTITRRRQSAVTKLAARFRSLAAESARQPGVADCLEWLMTASPAMHHVLGDSVSGSLPRLTRRSRASTGPSSRPGPERRCGETGES